MLQTPVNPRANNAYQRCQIQVEDPVGLVLRLYDGLIAFLRMGAEHLESQDYQEAANVIGRALDVIAYLQATLDLDRGGDVAANLDSLYDMARARVSTAHLRRSPSELLDVVKLVEPVRDAWASARVADPAPSTGTETP